MIFCFVPLFYNFVEIIRFTKLGYNDKLATQKGCIELIILKTMFCNLEESHFKIEMLHSPPHLQPYLFSMTMDSFCHFIFAIFSLLFSILISCRLQSSNCKYFRHFRFYTEHLSKCTLSTSCYFISFKTPVLSLNSSISSSHRTT